MFMNYMDYTDDACMNIFTQDQRDRVRALFAPNGVRRSFIENPYGLSIVGPSMLCISENYSISSLPTGATVSWSASPSVAVSISGSGSSVTVSRVAPYNMAVTLKMVISGLSCGDIDIEKEIQVGVPDHTQFQIFQSICNASYSVGFGAYIGSTIDKCSLPESGVLEIEWQVINSTGSHTIVNNVGPGVCVSSTVTTGILVNFSNNIGPKFVRFRARNSCGWSDWILQPVPVDFSGCNPWGYVIFPNPAGERLHIEPDERSGMNPTREKKEYRAILYDLNGKVAISVRSQDGNASLDTSQLPSSIYYLYIHTDGEKEGVKGQILITH